MRKRLIGLVACAALLFLVIACSSEGQGKDEGTDYSASPPASTEPRAMGESQFGKLEILPVAAESIEKLNAPSCYGAANDVQIQGSYRIVFKDLDNKITELKLPQLTGFIQPQSGVIDLKKMAFPDHDVFIIAPNYTDCHGIAFYLIAVGKDGAYLMNFTTDTGDSDQYDFAPNTELQVQDGLLVVRHGGAAGNEAVITQRFKPGFKKHKMELVLP